MKREALKVWDRHPVTGNLVRLKLAAGTPVVHQGFQRDEEGYHAWHAIWEYDSQERVLRYTYSSTARDCDGTVTNGGQWISELDGAGLPSARIDDETGLPVVSWTAERSWQRDLSAEAAGY